MVTVSYASCCDFRTRADIVVPLLKPITGVNGQLIREIPVQKDTPVIVGLRACNRSEAIWGPDAKEWKPERWLAPLPGSVAEAHVPGVYSNLYVIRLIYTGRS